MLETVLTEHHLDWNERRIPDLPNDGIQRFRNPMDRKVRPGRECRISIKRVKSRNPAVDLGLGSGSCFHPTVERPQSS